MNRILKRLPDRQSIVAVYASTVFVVYGWTVLTSFWKLPSWLYFMRMGEILSVYAYAFVVAFLESLLVLFVLLLIGFLLPTRWWKEHFTSLGLIWMTVVEGSVMFRLYTNRSPAMWEDFYYSQGTWWLYTLAVAFILSFLVLRVSWVQTGLDALADRLVVFLYLYIPITILSILTVFVRNLF